MKYVLLFLFVAGLMTWQPLFSQTKATSTRAGWKSFDAGVEHAKVSRKKILVDIYTDWCSWCKKMDEEVYSDPKVKEYLTKYFVIIKLNAEGEGTIQYLSLIHI